MPQPSRCLTLSGNMQLLKQCWGVNEQHTCTMAKVDLCVGGSYHLGMKAPKNMETRGPENPPWRSNF